MRELYYDEDEFPRFCDVCDRRTLNFNPIEGGKILCVDCYESQVEEGKFDEMERDAGETRSNKRGTENE